MRWTDNTNISSKVYITYTYNPGAYGTQTARRLKWIVRVASPGAATAAAAVTAVIYTSCHQQACSPRAAHQL